MLKTLESLGNLSGKTVLVRCGFDVPVRAGLVEESAAWRIEAALPFLKELSFLGARSVLLAHRGRPGGQANPALSLKPVFNCLKENFSGTMVFSTQLVGSDVEKLIAVLKDGEIVLLENLRFHSGEEANDPTFARELASLGELYINNDFATTHRAHASVVTLPKLLPSAAGSLIVKEIGVLQELRSFQGSELALVMGGAKAKTKLKVIDNFLQAGNQVCAAGVLANTLLKAKGIEVGKSVVDENFGEEGIDLSNELLTLPVDCVVSASLEKAEGLFTKNVQEVEPGEAIVDVGPQTVEIFSQKIAGAERVIWNGPLGRVEVPEFSEGSRKFAQKFIAGNSQTIVGGGDVVAFLSKEGFLESVGHVSAGGGAMLVFLAGQELPGLRALEAA